MEMSWMKQIVAKLLIAAVTAGLALAPASEARAGEDLKAEYCGYFYGAGWGDMRADNTRCTAPAGSYLTGFKATLKNQPEDISGTIIYQANLSGSGWLEWNDTNQISGAEGTDMPLEAIRVNLNGQLAELYDVYTSVYQNGQWTPWVANGETAGAEGQGFRLDGLRISVVVKGAGEPAADLVDPTRPMVALTFDDGPGASVTPRILDSLEANGGRATFFMVGNRVPQNAGLVKRMTDLGCQVGSHTMDHTYLTKMTPDAIVSNVGGSNQLITGAGGVSPIVMRPPGGYYDSAALNTLGNMGIAAIMWSVDTRDWQTRNAQKTIETVLDQVKDGDIVLMHDIYKTSADAAEVIIPELVRRGYQLVTVSELAQYRGGIAPGQVYFKFRP